MKQTTFEIKITVTEPVLGLASGNRQIQEEFIASKAPTLAAAKEELDAIEVPGEIEKATTVFPRDATGLFWWDYQMRGAFKGFLSALIELGDCKLSKWQYKRAVDLFLFVSPRRIYLRAPNGEVWQKAEQKRQRPLRAETMQGDRIALASSEELPEGTNWTMTVALLSGDNSKTKLAILEKDDIVNCLNFGKYSGFGQWRGGGFGRFTYEINGESHLSIEPSK